MLKIKRTDVRKSRGFKGGFKVIFVVILFTFLFIIGYFTASFFGKLLS